MIRELVVMKAREGVRLAIHPNRISKKCGSQVAMQTSAEDGILLKVKHGGCLMGRSSGWCMRLGMLGSILIKKSLNAL
jgi:hypothetical protein